MRSKRSQGVGLPQAINVCRVDQGAIQSRGCADLQKHLWWCVGKENDEAVEIMAFDGVCPLRLSVAQSQHCQSNEFEVCHGQRRPSVRLEAWGGFLARTGGRDAMAAAQASF